ncbi:prolyl oligopeptidase family serine peptidase [Nonomuraea sp. NPDC003201]
MIESIDGRVDPYARFDHSRVSYERFADIAYRRSFTWTSDAKSVCFISNERVQPNIWRLDVEEHMRCAVTAFADVAVRDFWLSDVRPLAVAQTDAGSERPSLHLVDIDQATTRPLSIPSSIRLLSCGTAGFRPGTTQLCLCVGSPGATGSQICLLEVDTGRLETLWSGGGVLVPVAFSVDGGSVVLRGASSNMSSNLYRLDASGALTALTSTGGQSSFRVVGRTVPVSKIPVITDHGADRPYLAEINPDTREVSTILRAPADVESAVQLRDGTYVCGLNDRGLSRIVAITPAGDQIACAAPPGVITELAVSACPDTAQQLVIGLATPAHPPDLLVAEVSGAADAGGMGWRTLATGRLSAEPAPAVWPEICELGGVPCLFYRPRGHARSFPVVLSLHGGPEAQERPDFAYNGMYQALLHRGIGVVAPNVSGSTGYGRSYQSRVYGDWGGQDLDDLTSVLHALDDLDGCSGTLRAAYGVSYGGFLALSLISRMRRDRLVAVAAINAPSHLPTLREDLPAPWRPFADTWMGSPADDDGLARRSPLNMLDSRTPPLLLVHGKLDPRVPLRQSQRLTERADELGIDAQLIVVDGGHGFTRNEDWKRTFGLVTDFLTAALADAESIDQSHVATRKKGDA